jgi:hypothetical protein
MCGSFYPSGIVIVDSTRLESELEDVNPRLLTMFAYLTDIHGNLSAARELVEKSKQRYLKVMFFLVGGDLTRRPDWNEDWVKAKNESIGEACKIFSELDLDLLHYGQR